MEVKLLRFTQFLFYFLYLWDADRHPRKRDLNTAETMAVCVLHCLWPWIRRNTPSDKSENRDSPLQLFASPFSRLQQKTYNKHCLKPVKKTNRSSILVLFASCYWRFWSMIWTSLNLSFCRGSIDFPLTALRWNVMNCPDHCSVWSFSFQALFFFPLQETTVPVRVFLFSDSTNLWQVY